MKVSKIFYATISIGISFGVSVVMVANGLLGKSSLSESLLTFFVIGIIATWAMVSLIQKLLPVWKQEIETANLAEGDMFRKIWESIVNWFVQPFPEHLPPQCFDCNEGSCDECLILAEWKEV